MVYKLNGEQPFQVLSSDFSISPSESGYELYFSADGFNYTSFATVGAGVTRQFTGMNAGNYYKLMGNTGEVSVNWERDCCGGQGGGGVAGVSSLNGQTGALTTKTINGNDILGSGDITISGSGSSVSYSQTLTAGTEIGQITIDGSATTIYAPEGGGSQGPTVIDFDAMSQSERATFYAELASVWSATSVNGDYVFLKSFADYTPENAGTRQIRLQFLWIEGTTAYFGTATRKADNDNAILSWGLDLGSDGTISTRTNGVNGVSKDTQLVGYFDTWNQNITFNKSTSGFTTNSEPMTDGIAFGGSFYWFVANAAQGDWGQAIPLLLFDVVDESGNTKTYQYPTISKQSVSETINGVSYILSVTADYGDFYYKMLLNENPYGAQFQYIEKPKAQGISQADYDALVQAGTVDANTLYVII